MEARYLRNFDALTEEEFRALRAGRVLVVGCGGLGGHLIELLARLCGQPDRGRRRCV